jgi:hypothetical protein
MMEKKSEMMVTRTTKRSAGNSMPEDPFKVMPETSMSEWQQKLSKDGRNPDITSDLPMGSGFNEPPGR